MKRIIFLLSALFLLSGCASLFGESSIDKTNQMIVDSNEGRLESFATAMTTCGDNQGCLVAVSMAFASNMGQQPLLRPESTLDYIRELRLWVDPVGNLITRLEGNSGTSGDRAANYIKGDGNILVIGNKTSASERSTASLSFSATPTKTQSWQDDMYNPSTDNSRTNQ